MLNFLYESKELDCSVFKGVSNGPKILPDQTSQLKEISHKYSLERVRLKLELHYFGHLM